MKEKNLLKIQPLPKVLRVQAYRIKATPARTATCKMIANLTAR